VFDVNGDGVITRVEFFQAIADGRATF
jgi:hypothetical protein